MQQIEAIQQQQTRTLALGEHERHQEVGPPLLALGEHRVGAVLVPDRGIGRIEADIAHAGGLGHGGEFHGDLAGTPGQHRVADAFGRHRIADLHGQFPLGVDGDRPLQTAHAVSVVLGIVDGHAGGRDVVVRDLRQVGDLGQFTLRRLAARDVGCDGGLFHPQAVRLLALLLARVHHRRTHRHGPLVIVERHARRRLLDQIADTTLHLHHEHTLAMGAGREPPGVHWLAVRLHRLDHLLDVALDGVGAGLRAGVTLAQFGQASDLCAQRVPLLLAGRGQAEQLVEGGACLRHGGNGVGQGVVLAAMQADRGPLQTQARPPLCAGDFGPPTLQHVHLPGLTLGNRVPAAFLDVGPQLVDGAARGGIGRGIGIEPGDGVLTPPAIEVLARRRGLEARLHLLQTLLRGQRHEPLHAHAQRGSDLGGLPLLLHLAVGVGHAHGPSLVFQQDHPLGGAGADGQAEILALVDAADLPGARRRGGERLDERGLAGAVQPGDQQDTGW